MTDLFMKRGATYSPCGTLRWTLTREWGDGPTCCYIGHNPSTAGHEIDDPTSQAWVHFARAHGFGRYEAVNLYPFRTPDPKICQRWADMRSSAEALAKNLEVVALAAARASAVVACWGAIARDPIWIELVIDSVIGARLDLHCLGTTQSGDPKHVMARGLHRIDRDQRFAVWRAAAGA